MKKIILTLIVVGGLATIGVAVLITRPSASSPKTVTPAPTLPTASQTNSLIEDIVKQRWLVFFQNPYELRATGGFWGTIGSVSWDEHKKMQYWVNDVYAIDGPADWNDISMPAPPKAIQKYIRINSWYLRDANWDPDFPTSAQRALSFYDLETQGNQQFNAVATINPDVLRDILTITGPITVDGITITSKDTLETIIDAVEISYRKKKISPSQRKTILYHLVQAIINHPKRNQIMVALSARLSDYQQRGVIQLYAQNPQVQQKIVDAGWSGQLKHSSDDYLAVIDSNLAALKTDAVVGRRTDYTAVRTPEQTTSTVTLTYRNGAKKFDYRTTRYRTYTRVLVPAGARLVSSSGTLENDRIFNPAGNPGMVDQEQYQGKTMFGFFLAVEPGTTRQVTLQYTVPRVNGNPSNEYHLLVQHQSGVPERPLTLRVQSDTTSEPPIILKREGKQDEFVGIALPK